MFEHYQKSNIPQTSRHFLLICKLLENSVQKTEKTVGKTVCAQRICHRILGGVFYFLRLLEYRGKLG